jgi:hypothetical protein
MPLSVSDVSAGCANTVRCRTLPCAPTHSGYLLVETAFIEDNKTFLPYAINDVTYVSISHFKSSPDLYTASVRSSVTLPPQGQGKVCSQDCAECDSTVKECQQNFGRGT